ncbi:hypothetical protein MMC19_001523 [Ptychographa xylographoides]|nr:hypothetical protein [Ptychographa xylographoides]
MAALLFGHVHGHMIMASPTPYGKSSLNNSPLAADGSDFPCKQRAGVYDAEGASNTMPIGVNQTLSFTGSAVHGGGSCQVALTTDLQPTASTQWQVIYSIMGGCPANVPGNLPENANGNGASTFQFSVPEGISPGQYTLAWTWFNKVGNREMYMNCAPVTVTGGSSKREIPTVRGLDAPPSKPGLTKRTTFPPMFLANMGNGCISTDSADLLFPDPGQYVQYAGIVPGAALTAPHGTCVTAASSSGSSSGSNSSGAGAPASSAVASAAAPPSPVASAMPIGSIIASAFPSSFSVVASPLASAPAVATSAPAAAPSPAPAAAPAAAPASSGTTTTPSAGASTGACPTEGEWNCIGGSSFQQCASGAWSVVQPMAPGTQCTPGESSNLTITRKRGIRFSKAHLRRHAKNLGH